MEMQLLKNSLLRAVRVQNSQRKQQLKGNYLHINKPQQLQPQQPQHQPPQQPPKVEAEKHKHNQIQIRNQKEVGIHISNITCGMKRVDIIKECKRFGKIWEIRIPKGERKGYVDVIYENWEDAKDAYERLDKK